MIEMIWLFFMVLVGMAMISVLTLVGGCVLGLIIAVVKALVTMIKG